MSLADLAGSRNAPRQRNGLRSGRDKLHVRVAYFTSLPKSENLPQMLIEISDASQLADATEKLRDRLKSLADRQHDVEWSTPAGNRAEGVKSLLAPDARTE